MKLTSTQKTALWVSIAVLSIGISILIWWITKRRSERVLLGAGTEGNVVTGSGTGGNIVASAVQTVVDMTKETTGMYYFTINELTRSATAKSLGIDNTPTPSARASLETLIAECLDPIRRIYGKPIIVSSGYRSLELNAAVGGVTNSQHTKGEAADIVPASGGSLRGIFDAAIRHGNFDQLIVEIRNGRKWIHISYGPRMRHRIMYYKFDGTGYHDITSTYPSVIGTLI